MTNIFRDELQNDFGTWPIAYIPYGGADFGEIQAVAAAIGDWTNAITTPSSFTRGGLQPTRQSLHHAEDIQRTPALLAAYRARSASVDGAHDAENAVAWRSVYRTALHAERRAIQNLRAEDAIDDAVARQLLSELDLLEAALMHRPLHASG